MKLGVRTFIKRTKWLEWWAIQLTTSLRSRKVKRQPRWLRSTHAAKHHHQRLSTRGKNRIHGAKHGTMIRAIKNGWSNKSELFTEHGEGFIHFIHRDKLDDGRPHLLALDQHYSDLHNLISPTNEQIHITALHTLPSHISHWIYGCSRAINVSTRVSKTRLWRRPSTTRLRKDACKLAHRKHNQRKCCSPDKSNIRQAPSP